MNGAWFEPSGLNQFFAMKNGTVPIVSTVGGLVDSIKRGENGFLFDIVPGKNGEPFEREATAMNAYTEFQRAIEVFGKPARLRKMRIKGMNENNSWDLRVIEDFLPLFKAILEAGCASDLLPGAVPNGSKPSRK